MVCILCLAASDEMIRIFEEQGFDLNVNSIIVKHFWLQPNQEDANARAICSSCWIALDTFHKFYEKVEAAHVNLLNKVTTATGQGIKEEYVSDDGNLNSCTDFLSADVKIEVKEDYLGCLSQENPLPEVETKVDTPEALEKPKHSAVVDSDSDSEIPLATLVTQRTLKHDTAIANSSPSLDIVSNVNESDYECNEKMEKVEDASCGKSNHKATKTNASSSKVRYRQRKSKPEGEEKRKTTETVKRRKLSRQFDEIIEKNMKLFCSICHLPLVNFFFLRKHFQSAHNELGYATCCGKKFLKRGLLVDHIYFHLNPEYFKCDKCNRILADRRGLEAHMDIHDTTKPRIYQCDKCNKSFCRKLLLKNHTYTHIHDGEFNCEFCQKLFSSKYSRQRHINNVHKTAYMKICEQCGKSIQGLEAFRRHQMGHSGIPKPLLQCEKCDVKVTSKYGLKKHMNSMHPGSKVLHKCEVCGKIAPSAAALQRHTSYMHKSERHHKCPMCEKAFKISRNLRPSAENANDKVICSSCWKELDSFHKFYQKVEEAHSKLISTWTVESTDILSAAIRIAGIKQDLGEESDDVDILSSDDDSDCDEIYNKNDCELNLRRTPKKELDQVIQQHMKLSCNICQEPMRNFYMLKRHFESVHHESGYVICCKLKFKSRNSLADHIYLDHNLIYLCDKCGQIMADYRALNMHKATHTNCLSSINVTSAVTVRIENNRKINYQN